jgi:hypothetical protein
MRTALIMISLFVAQIFSQDITVLKPGQSFSAKDSALVLTIPRFNKMDSVIKASQKQIADYKKDSVAYFTLRLVLDSTSNKLQLVQQKSVLLATKDSVLVGIDSLMAENVRTYQSMVSDLQEAASKNKASSGGFFSDTFWFGSGTVVGIVVMYLGSLIVHNVK